MHIFFKEKYKEQFMFSELFSNFLDEFDSKTNLVNNKKYNLGFMGIYEHIVTNIFSYSIRALIRELHDYKNNNLLYGESKEQRFKSFEKVTEDKQFLIKFYEKYPVIKSYIEQKIDQTFIYTSEIISNFEKDKLQIEEAFNIKLEEIVDIDLGKGDVHNNGKSVAIIKCNSSKIVYKPHSLRTDIIFEEVVEWVNSKSISKPKLKTLKVIDHHSYGWQEFINYQSCNDLKEIENYYYKCGCFLGIFYTLGTNDIHYENMIVNGENPYFIDLETLFAINNSAQLDTVLTTGFIPNRCSTSLFDMDLSGLCGETTISTQINTIGIINPKTDEMRIETQPAQIFSSDNLVKLNDKNMNIEDYAENFVEGFRDTLYLISDNKMSYLNCIEKQILSNQKFRQVLRFTHVYAKFLAAASHPDFLNDKSKHKELFNKLYNGCNNSLDHDRISNEIDSLMKWDIPYYHCNYDSNNLFSNDLLISNGFFKLTIKECLYKRIENLNKKIIDFQIDVIKKSLFTVYKDKFLDSGNINIDLVERVNNCDDSIIMKISEQIASNILEVEESDQIAFLINTFEKEKALLSPINFNLYDGGGIIWLFACVGNIYKNEYYRNISKKLLDTSVMTYEYYNSKQEHLKERISAFSGIGSLLYLYYNMYKLDNNENYFAKYQDTAKIIIDSNYDDLDNYDNSINYDFLCGISGILVLVCKIYLSSKDEMSKRIIDKYSEYLLNYLNKNDINGIGLAHGISGYVLALIMIYRTNHEELYLELANKLIRKEDEIYLKNQSEKENKTSWCNGETGMLIANHELLKIKYDKNRLAKIYDLIKAIIDKGLYNMNNMCLCHGIYGNIEVVKKVLSEIDDVKYEIELDKISLYDLKDIQLGLKNNFQIDTFMIGTSGIAYSELRNKYNYLPSILYLDILD